MIAEKGQVTTINSEFKIMKKRENASRQYVNEKRMPEKY